MSRAARISSVIFCLVLFAGLVAPVAAAQPDRGAAAEKRVTMCGRSCMNNWFLHWGWDESGPVQKNGYTLDYRGLDGDLGHIANSFAGYVSGLSAGSVAFFKFCFVDFYGDNLSQLQGIINDVIQTAEDNSLKLIIGNALPYNQTSGWAEVVTEYQQYNAFLDQKAAASSDIWVYDFYSVLAGPDGLLKPEDDMGDSHPNGAAYTALDPSFFTLLGDVFDGGDRPIGPPDPVVRSWYFAEGTTAHGFEEYICVQNPTATDAVVQCVYMLPEVPGAGTSRADPFAVPAFSRTTVTVSNDIGQSDASVRVDSDQNIICERSMYWNGRIDGHDSIGVTAPQTEWFLAEGCTDYGFEEYICIQNPQATAATVDITYNTSSGAVEMPSLEVSAGSRKTVNVNEDLGDPCSVSARLESDQPIVVERAMYWDGRRGGHSSKAVSAPATDWFLAEGSTDWGFDTYVLLQNPGGADANVDIDFLTSDGTVELDDVPVKKGSRYTVDAREYVGNVDFSTSITADAPIICERAMYWNNGTGKAGHDTVGVTEATYNCYLAEGCTDYGFDTYLLICNPNAEVNDVQVTYMTATGAIPHGGIKMAPRSRETVYVNDMIPAGDVSIHVAGDYPVAAERAMYWNNRGGGHNSIGLTEN